MKKFQDYLLWEQEAITRNLLYCPIAMRPGFKFSVDVEVAFKREGEKDVEYGVFNFKRNFGALFDEHKDLVDWVKLKR